MEFDALGPKDGAGAWYEDRRRRLEEEEWLFRLGVVQFGDVVTGKELVG